MGRTTRAGFHFPRGPAERRSVLAGAGCPDRDSGHANPGTRQVLGCSRLILDWRYRVSFPDRRLKSRSK